MLVARWRDNGGWFWNPNRFTISKLSYAMQAAKLAQSGNAQSGEAFSKG
jgi:hypothetical protein